MSERIETRLYENEGKLQIEDGVASAIILDIELDPIKCFFTDGGEVVDIQTEKLSYISLSVENLHDLIRLTEEASEYYENKFEEDE